MVLKEEEGNSALFITVCVTKFYFRVFIKTLCRKESLSATLLHIDNCQFNNSRIYILRKNARNRNNFVFIAILAEFVKFLL